MDLHDLGGGARDAPADRGRPSDEEQSASGGAEARTEHWDSSEARVDGER
jgi:hypothetical protein